VLFDSVSTAASYSLAYIGDDGQASTIVLNTPFDSLQDDLLPSENNDVLAATPEQQS